LEGQPVTLLRLSNSSSGKPNASKALRSQAAPGRQEAAVLSLAKGNGGVGRPVITCLVAVCSCIIWIAALSLAGAGKDGLPWYLAISGSIIYFCGYLRSQGESHSYEITNREPIKFHESLAFTYFFAALALYGWICLKPLMVDTQRQDHLVQIVDIQLTSDKDFADRQSPLPGTKTEEVLHKRTADQQTKQQDVVGERAPSPVTEKPSVAAKSERQIRRAEREQPQPSLSRQPKPAFPMIISPERTPYAASNEGAAPPVVTPPQVQPRRIAQKSNPEPQAFMQEVKVADLVEVVENDGQKDQSAVFQAGGKSTGGKGANNDLSDYLKGLHKRIKHAWSPPRGQSRVAKLLFRLKKDGALGFIKIVVSSGDNETDLAAIHAVSEAAGRKLPDTFAGPNLDVEYTFNYSADQLQEVSPAN
jgi:hypothetical protein